MPVIRHIEIRHFRAIRAALWAPNEGINAVIGAGDTGKSSLLEAVEMALAPRRNLTFSDADFFGLDVQQPIDIRVTIGTLPDALLDLDRYGSFHRGWDPVLGLNDEPAAGYEPVITIRLAVDQDLEPRWSLYSDRAEIDGLTRELPAGERQRLAPVRLGVFANHHLAWGTRSVLNKLGEISAGAGGALADAARQARSAFGNAALGQVEDTLRIVHEVGIKAGISGAMNATALLDAHGITLTGGTIALHDAAGVPLRNLGAGSARLLIAGLQAAAGDGSPFILVDELEHGLEPFRIVRLLHTLGSKDPVPQRQVFLTTHSPVTLRELSAHHLWRAANIAGAVTLRRLGSGPDDQATLRACAEAFLAPTVIMCEGATEIGLLRGIDLYTDEQRRPTLARYGAALADGHGSSMVQRACCFAKLGYRTGLLHDCDVPFPPDRIAALAQAGVTTFCWDTGLSTEQQLCRSLPDEEIEALVKIAVAEHGRDKIEGDLRNQAPQLTPDYYWAILGITAEQRDQLGAAAKKGGWFKNITLGERVGRDVVGPALDRCQGTFPLVIRALGAWIAS